MSAKQDNSPNRIDTKRLTLYALFVAAAMVFSYIESLVPLFFIAPGVKIGLANAVSLFLAAKGRYKGAFAVNISRILLSALLFGSAVSLVFSLSGGIVSLIVTVLLHKTNLFGIVGISIAGAVTHNLVQLLAAVLLLGGGVLYYAPVLVVSGIVCGLALGTLDFVIIKKIKTNL